MGVKFQGRTIRWYLYPLLILCSWWWTHALLCLLVEHNCIFPVASAQFNPLFIWPWSCRSYVHTKLKLQPSCEMVNQILNKATRCSKCWLLYCSILISFIYWHKAELSDITLGWTGFYGLINIFFFGIILLKYNFSYFPAFIPEYVRNGIVKLYNFSSHRPDLQVASLYSQQQSLSLGIS